ncbi:MAG: peptide deformylase [Deltaproteobacteria bacterium]|nr:peptide deformylase [Deltaproteobacteria bacterium]MCK5709867.1 peptide deformylase [Deltaproteobacteria bacterium]
MGKILEIAELGHPVLRERASEIENLGDQEIQNFIDDLIATAIDSNGVGIAAPQVFEPKRIFIISSRPNVRYPNAPEMGPTALINPEIISFSEEKEKDWEGCLSIPGIRGLVPRHKLIKVKYLTRDGKEVEGEFSDFIARIFQHELDHLNGIVFLDRMDSNKELVTEKEYQRLISKAMEEMDLENEG